MGNVCLVYAVSNRLPLFCAFKAQIAPAAQLPAALFRGLMGYGQNLLKGGNAGEYLSDAVLL